jgi:hypothetical protein
MIWPRGCAGWLRPELTKFIAKYKLWTVVVGNDRLLFSSKRAADAVLNAHGGINACTLNERPSAVSKEIASTIIAATFGDHAFAPALPCGLAAAQPHRQKESPQEDFDSPTIPTMVTKLLDRPEARSNPKAIEAIKSEARALVEAGTWIEDTVIEKHLLVANAKASGETIHLGDLMSICSVKNAEGPESLQSFKGRVCFRGDSVKDQEGLAAIFQEMSSCPTTIHTTNSTIAYGSLPGNACETADAVRAYIQCELKSVHRTWVRIPRELWPASWHDKGYVAPMCLLVKALYGHPESGGHWEQHLTSAVVAIGGETIPDHPSSFWFPESRALLTVYVDDLMLSGPIGSHAAVWAALRAHPIDIDAPEPLTRFLGRTHHKVSL